VRMLDRPDAISKFFMHSNVIDKHDQACQFELHLEKCWVTLDPYFRLHTTIFGRNVAMRNVALRN
jgi:protein-disulfide isomerase